MSNYKFEWPYIKYLTLKDIENYQSDLPKDLDELEVRHLVPSILYHDNPYTINMNPVYLTPEISNLKNEFWASDTV